MREPTHRCPAPGCTSKVPRRHFACAAHWRALPEAHQGAITSATIGSAAHTRAMLEAVRWYRGKARERHEDSTRGR